MDTNNTQSVKYSPAAIVNIFNNSINVGEERKIIEVEGVYLKQNSREYNEFYYDKIKDIQSDKSLTLVVHKSVKESLIDNYIYTFSGYINRRILDSGNIQINFWANKVLSTDLKPNNESELKVIDIRGKKSLRSYKSFQYAIESKLLNGYKPYLALILGNNAVVKDDIFNTLGKELNNFVIDEFRLNLSSKDEIISGIRQIEKSKNYDALIIARGGGSGMEVFNNIEVVEYLSSINTILVTAIGHADDFSLLQGVSDCNFDTPTSLGAYLKSTSEKIINIYSKVYLEVTTLKKQIEDDKQLKEKLQDEIKSYSNEVNNLKIEITNSHSKLHSLKLNLLITVIIAISLLSIVFLLIKK